MTEGPRILCTDDVTARCIRCIRELNRNADGAIVLEPFWLAIAENGWITALICPDCVTYEERAESVIREAIQRNYVGPDWLIHRQDLEL